ncbi:FAS1 domain-containing protein [Hesseltinella vesiculosa]|uniref:FAS1 domain-containing protein n=1 Tax=Hesseltinella vesiculosa TaxID=101127 RepID=A0A1X2GBT7_9FUNG|nr:FAS1 domain-containing protein [Hesseltinella vesiculosa]
MKFPLLLLIYPLLPVFGYKTIIDVLSEDERFHTLVTHLQHTRLVPFINNLTTATFFAPDNHAFEIFNGDIDKNTLLYHLVPFTFQTQDFYHGQLLSSLYERPNVLGSNENDIGQRIKVTKEGKQSQGRSKVFINQAQIITQDIPVNNHTFIQAIDQLLTPPPMLDTFLPTYPLLDSLLKQADVNALLQQEAPFTVFLSQADPLHAFNNIEANYMTSTFGKKDLQRYLNYLIIEGFPTFADGLQPGLEKVKTRNGETLLLETKQDGSKSINGIPIIQQDILAANGVVHELGDLPIPASLNFDARKYMYGLNTTKFVDLLDRYGLSSYLDASPHHYTFLAPENAVIDENEIPNHDKRAWLSYHIANGSWTPDQFYDGMMLDAEYIPGNLGPDVHQKIPIFVDEEDILNSKPSLSIRFGRARALANNVSIHGNVIYQVSDTLAVPGDLLSQLVVDLDLSTFIATLYVSGLADDLQHHHGITLFVPTNTAFQRLGLLTKFLVHPAGKSQLKTILRYHVVQQLLYYDDMLHRVYEVPTLANDTLLRTRPTGDKSRILIGPPDGNDSEAGAIVQDPTEGSNNILMANGVVHKVEQVQIPAQVKISNYDLLVGMGATTMLKVLEKANLTETLNRSDTVVLVPTDRAFARVDLTALFNDPVQLDRVARFHFLQSPWQTDVSLWQADYDTLLSNKDKVIIKQQGNDHDNLVVTVKDKESMMAEITGLGRVTAGRGGVLEINAVLIPIHRGIFGLPFIWSIVVLIVILSISSSILGVVGFIGYKIYTRRRLGYRAIGS